MTDLTNLGLSDDVVQRLCGRAVRNGHSLHEEIRLVLAAAVSDEPPPGIGTRMHARFAVLGGAELDIPPRTELPRDPGLA